MLTTNIIIYILYIPGVNINLLYYVYTVALDLAFSSMYRDTVPVTVDRICPTVAAATMLQLVCIPPVCCIACISGCAYMYT